MKKLSEKLESVQQNLIGRSFSRYLVLNSCNKFSSHLVAHIHLVIGHMSVRKSCQSWWRKLSKLHYIFIFHLSSSDYILMKKRYEKILENLNLSVLQTSGKDFRTGIDSSKVSLHKKLPDLTKQTNICKSQ